MSERSQGSSGITEEPLRLELKIWHPECWTLNVTEKTDGGLIAHGIYTVDDLVNARLTAYGDSYDEIEALIDEIETSPLTDSVQEVTSEFNTGISRPIPGNVSQELLVRYPEKRSIYNSFVLRDFIPDEPIQIEGGHELWTVITNTPRSEIQRQLKSIRTNMDAEITVESITTQGGGTPTFIPKRETLSARQQEVFTLAQKRGYYEWPRQISADELATELDISKTTLLEHLRKAEAKLLGPD